MKKTDNNRKAETSFLLGPGRKLKTIVLKEPKPLKSLGPKTLDLSSKATLPASRARRLGIAFKLDFKFREILAGTRRREKKGGNGKVNSNGRTESFYK